jgi:hypothetical protein
VKTDDPIVSEVRKARQSHAKRFGYDVHKISADLRKIEREAATRPVSRSPRRIYRKAG